MMPDGLTLQIPLASIVAALQHAASDALTPGRYASEEPEGYRACVRAVRDAIERAHIEGAIADLARQIVQERLRPVLTEIIDRELTRLAVERARALRKQGVLLPEPAP